MGDQDRDVSLAMSPTIQAKVKELRHELGARMVFAIVVDEHSNFHALASVGDEATKRLAESLQKDFGERMRESESFDVITMAQKAAVARG